MKDLFGNGGIGQWSTNEFAPTAAAPRRPDFGDILLEISRKDFAENKPETSVLAKVIAIFDFEDQESTDLGFKKGEEIEVLKKDGDWWSGRIGPNRTVNFPFNYVKVPEKMDDSDPLAQGGTHKKTT